MLETIEVCSSKNPAQATVIWLHGLGADGHNFANLVPELKLDPSLSVRFIFPHAPMRPVTLSHGAVMRAWFDIMNLQIEGLQDELGIQQTSIWMDELIQQEQRRGIPSERIVLAGFSQGGAVALYAGLRCTQKLGGILALSTFLPLPDKLAQEGSVINKDIPIFLAHGVGDTVVTFDWATVTRDVLLNLGYAVQWHTYPMLHELCREEIKHIKEWIEQRFDFN